jgi:hypothetical protein
MVAVVLKVFFPLRSLAPSQHRQGTFLTRCFLRTGFVVSPAMGKFLRQKIPEISGWWDEELVCVRSSWNMTGGGKSWTEKIHRQNGN